uniref:DUF2232 domain-containing protein n=1 Tax=Candidatus Kentrum sp. SD TaxID=2126332 RepID=A0A451BIP6_9GAMM|nr:MAG: hypothetical protein BECKSD772D_GA0070982_100831 [Candidatus Kentron sp. SD]
MGLATLRNGFLQGALVTGAAMFLSGIAMWFFMGTTAPVIVFMMVTGLPILLLAATLRHTRSLGTTMAVAGLCAAAGVIVLHVGIDDPLAWWRDRLHGILMPSGHASGIDTRTVERLEALIEALAPMMTALPAGIMFGAILVLFLARWWHAILDNPAGFRDEFHGLRLDSRLAVLATIVLGFSIFVDQAGGISDSFLQIFVILYLFQGLAVFHGIIAARGASHLWLVLLYLLLVFDLLGLSRGVLNIPDIPMIFLVITGIMDTWFDFRARVMDKQRAREQ